MRGLTLSAAALLAFLGLFWRSWNRRAPEPMWLLGGVIAFVVIGELLHD